MNERGFLPKAKREDLDERLTRRLDRWYERAYQDDNLFLTMARRPGWQRFVEAFGIVPDRWQEGEAMPWEPSS